MNITYHGSGIKFTAAMKTYANERIHESLDCFKDRNISVKVNLKKEGRDKIKLEILVSGIKLKLARINKIDFATNYYELLSAAVSSLKIQIEKYLQTKTYRKRNNDLNTLFDIKEIDESKVSKEKVFILDNLTDEEAIDEMNIRGHEFYAYKNDENLDCIVYKRTDGKYGKIILK